MTAITIESLGISKDELIDRVVDRTVTALLHSYLTDDEDGEPSGTSAFATAMQKKVQERINTAIEEIAAKNVLPNVASYVENLVLQETNRWGEKIGKPVTFTEYLIERAGNYITEPVNFEGKAERERNGYSWSKSTTRVAFMVHQHLQYSIKTAMEKAFADANTKVVGGLHEAMKIALENVTESLKVEVKTK